MDKIVVEGGRRLTGTITVSGSKNASLALLCAALLTPDPVVLRNVPRLKDVETMLRLLRTLGVTVDPGPPLVVRAAHVAEPVAPYDLVRTMRASVMVLGPLVARLGRARVSLPGGCAIGARPIDVHLKGLVLLGAAVTVRHGYVEATANRLRGAHIYLDFPTVTGTENLLMAAALAEGRTVLENAAREPEIAELAEVLNRMGAKVSGAGSPTILVDGVERLNGADYTVMGDRIEAGTLLVAGALTGGDVRVRGALAAHEGALLEKLGAMGAQVGEERDGLHVVGTHPIHSVDIKTAPFPGFATDMQAQVMAMLALADGLAVVSETVFENRFMHVAELRRMGAAIEVQGNTAIVKGVPHLTGAPVMASDLRASAALILAGLAARGTTEVHRVYHLDRGYEGLERKLASLGAIIARVPA